MIIVDEKTRQRIVVDPHCGDVVYEKKSTDTSVTNESVLVTGKWQDYTGSGGVVTRNLLLSPLPNQFEGTDPGVMGESLGNLNEVGQNSNIYRRRVIREYKSW